MSDYLKRAFILGKNLVSVSAENRRLTTLYTVDKDLLEDVGTALCIHKTTLQKRAMADERNREKLFASKVAVNAEFRKFRADMHANVD